MGAFDGVDLANLELSGERLILRRWELADAPAVHEVMRDRTMYDFLPRLPDPYTLDVAREYVTGLGHEGRDAGTGIGSAVVEIATGRVVGSIALRVEATPSEAGDIGYWIGADARGNGYAAEATRVLAEWAFAHGLPRVGLSCDVRNLASARTALSAGFRFEGIGRDAAPAAPTSEQAHDLARFARLATDPPQEVPPAFAALPTGGLTDGVLTLRVMRPGDAPALAETDDELTLRWGFGSQPHALDEVRRAADRAGLDWLVGGVAAFSLVDAATGQVAGSLRLRKQGPPQVGGIGYVVHPAFRGRGFTSRALRLLVPWAFDVAEFARLELGAKVGNAASLRAAASAGFDQDGVRVKRLRNTDGTFSDEGRYALNNPKYA